MKTILSDLKSLTNGSVGQIVQKFSGNTPGYNWKLKDEPLVGGLNAYTSQAYDKKTGTVTTSFDASKFANATNLSIARTILHESVHAYLVAFFSSDPLAATKTYPQLMENYLYNKDSDVAHHVLIAENFVKDIAKSLEGYGKSKGHVLSTQFYNDLAWGGLTHTGLKDTKGFWILTNWFQNTYSDPLDRDRIIEVISIEQSGTDMDGIQQPQSGSDTNCN